MKINWHKYILKIYTLWRRVYTQSLLSLTFGAIGHKTTVYRLTRLVNPDRIYLGRSVTIFGDSRIELIKNYAGEKFNPALRLEDDTQLHQNCHITCANHIKIGKGTIVVANVTITDIIHPYDDPSIPTNKTRLITKPVEIGEFSYLYNNVVVMPGTRIGSHCIIGANSIVSGQIPDYTVAVGSPAKVIKKYNLEAKEWHNV